MPASPQPPPPPTPASLRWRRALWLVDGLTLVVLLTVALAGWPRGMPPGGVSGLEDVPPVLWRLGSAADFTLHGPDAGYWAEAARDLVQGGEVSCRRMPVFLHGIALATHLHGDVVFAGHFVGHLATVLSVLLTWLLARLVGDRGSALGAALLTALCPVLVDSQTLYGVDTSFRAATLVAAIGVVLGLRGSWWRGLFAGAGLGLCAGTHYLGLLLPLPGSLLLLTVAGTWRQRLARTLGCAGTVLLVLVLLRPGCPFFSPEQVGGEFSVGIASSLDRWDLLGARIGTTAPLVVSGLLTAAAKTLADNLAALVPRAPSVTALVLLCLVGLFAPQPARRPRWDWRIGLWLVVLLLPLVGLEAASAPQRYRNYAGPLLWVLLARGGGGLLGWLDLGLRRWVRPWPVGALGLLCGAGVAAAVQGEWRAEWRAADDRAGLHDLRLGALVRRHFPEVPCLLGFTAETAFYAGKPTCPMGVCAADDPAWQPAGGGEDRARAVCQDWIRRSCGPADAFPWVVETEGSAGLPVALAPPMDRWVLAEGTRVGSVETEHRRSLVFGLPCAQGIEPPDPALGSVP